MTAPAVPTTNDAISRRRTEQVPLGVVQPAAEAALVWPIAAIAAVQVAWFALLAFGLYVLAT